jgi:3-isopropylmalate dehydratase small subunit
MKPLCTITSIAVPLAEANIDTDIIFPARFLTITSKVGLGKIAFYDWRYGPDGREKSDFVLNHPAFCGAEILIAGDNFGSGSSREQAPWALLDLGIRCIISSSFGEIFRSNCFRNGMLAITVSPEDLKHLFDDASSHASMTVDLVDCLISTQLGTRIEFTIDPERRFALINGLDEIAATLDQMANKILDFEQSQRTRRPWLYADAKKSVAPR